MSRPLTGANRPRRRSRRRACRAPQWQGSLGRFRDLSGCLVAPQKATSGPEIRLGAGEGRWRIPGGTGGTAVARGASCQAPLTGASAPAARSRDLSSRLPFPGRRQYGPFKLATSARKAEYDSKRLSILLFVSITAW
ncbi:MAG: hypothetical protein LBO66_12425 [Deltaproteobacteria bacterium]|nr:hypothetical protein [Deltaproteobacteria bacterium]